MSKKVRVEKEMIKIGHIYQQPIKLSTIRIEEFNYNFPDIAYVSA